MNHEVVVTSSGGVALRYEGVAIGRTPAIVGVWCTLEFSIHPTKGARLKVTWRESSRRSSMHAAYRAKIKRRHRR